MRNALTQATAAMRAGSRAYFRCRAAPIGPEGAALFLRRPLMSRNIRLRPSRKERPAALLAQALDLGFENGQLGGSRRIGRHPFFRKLTVEKLPDAAQQLAAAKKVLKQNRRDRDRP
jgi:hypothetical protein